MSCIESNEICLFIFLLQINETYLLHQLVSLFFGCLDFPQLSQLFHCYLGLATRNKQCLLFLLLNGGLASFVP